MGSPGQSWEDFPLEPLHFWSDSHGQSWPALDSHGKTFLRNLYISGVTVMGSHGQPWTVTEDLPLEPLHFWSDSHDQS